MFRPKEPDEDRRQARANAPIQRAPVSGSLLDQTGPAGDDEYTRPVYRAYRHEERPPETPHPSAATPPLRDDTSSIDARLQAQWQSLTQLGIGHIVHWLQRGFYLIVILAVVGVIAAFGYAKTATPRYTVFTDLIVDPSDFSVTNEELTAASPQRDSQLLEVDSKLRVMTSGNVLRQVIRDQKLTEDPEFFKAGMLASLLGGESDAGSEEQRELSVQRVLEQRVKAQREERSFVVVLSVWTDNPEKSVRLSTAIVEAFQTQLFQSSSESAGRIAANINARLDELRSSVSQAEEIVEKFKRDNQLQTSSGELTSSRISSALDTQVLDAQQRLIMAETRYNQMRSAVADRRTASATIFDSAGMTTLRGNFTLIEQQIGAMTRTYGARHPRLVALQSERGTLERAIAEEADRILQQARTDADQARSTLAQLRSRSDSERATVYTNNDAQVQLRELERDARAKATVYEAYLSRTHQISERQEIDTSNVRVISNPVPPKSKSWPPSTLLLMIGGGMVGGMVGIGLALLFGLLGHLRRARPVHAYA